MQCSQGHGNPDGTRFCRSCGELLEPPEPAATPEPPHGPRRDLLVVTGAIAVVALFGLGAWALFGRHSSSGTRAGATTTTRASGSATTDGGSATSASDPNGPLDAKGMVRELEATLRTAAKGRRQLNQFTSRLASCDLSAADGALLGAIVDNREATQRQATAVADRTQGDTTLARSLANLMGKSAQADRSYAAWLGSRGSSSSCKLPDDVRRLNADVSTAKARWVADFNRAARRHHYRANWHPSDF